MSEIERIVGIAVAARSENGDALKTIQISPPGRTQSLKGVWVLDAENAAELIAAFEGHGVPLAIDYDHQTLLPHLRPADGLARASGRIVRMRWDETRGLLGDVEWTELARQVIQAGQYAFISPVFDVDKQTRRVVEMGPPALVNTPATPHAERVAASLTPGAPGTPQTPPGSKPPTTPSGESGGRYPKLTEKESKLMDELKKLLNELGANLAEDATAEAIISAASAQLKPLTERKEPAEGGGEQVAASAAVCKKLGLPETSTEQVICTALDKLTGHVGYVPVEHVNELQEQVNKLQEAESERNAERLVASYSQQGKLNAHDAKQMKWANKAARDNPEGFLAVLAGAPVIIPQGRTTPPAGSNAAGNSREAVIASAVREYDEKPGQEGLTSRIAFINVALGDKGLPILTEAEAKAHAS